jgi:hypothetical protein
MTRPAAASLNSGVRRIGLNALALSGLLVRFSGLVLSSDWLAVSFLMLSGFWLALNFWRSPVAGSLPIRGTLVST